MKKNILQLFVPIALLLISSNLAAQSTQNDSSINSLQKGKFSIQFGIGANLVLQSFNNYSLSAKYNISSKSALRLGVGGDYSDKNGNILYDTIPRETYSNSYSFTVDFSYIYYINPKSKVNIFIGGGPVYAKSHEYDEGPSDYLDYIFYRSSNSWQAGIKAVLGAEWFFLKYMSLFVEYEAAFTYGKNEVEYKSLQIEGGIISRRSVEENVTLFKANTAKFGLSIYF